MKFTCDTKVFFKMLPLSILMFWASFISAQVYPQSSLVKDLQAGTVGSSPRYFTNLGNKTFFLANTDANQPAQLMVTDGNDATVSSLISTPYTGITAPVIFNGQLYFGLQQTNSITLWRSVDGVSASLVDTVWKGSEYVRFYEDYVFVKNNELFVKVSRNLSYNADSVMDLFKSSGQSNGLVNLGLIETKYSNAESSSSEIFRGGNVSYFLTNFYAFSNGYMGVRVSVGNNAPVINYTWSVFQQPTVSIIGLGVLNNDFIFLNNDTLARLNPQGQREALLTGIQYGSKIAQVNNLIYFNSLKGIYRTDGTSTGTILISENSSSAAESKPFQSDDISVIGDTLYICGGNYNDKFGIWQINNTSTVFKRILYIEAPKPSLWSVILNNKLYLSEEIGNKTTLYEPDFANNKVKILGQLDRWSYSDSKAKKNFTLLNNNFIGAAGDDDATAVTANAKGLELRRLSLTPSVSAYPCVADTTRPGFYSCPNNLTFIKYNLSPNWCYSEPIPRPNAFDYCSGVITGVSAQKGQFLPESDWKNGQPLYSYCTLGVDTVVYWARDISYNVTKCSFPITISPPPSPCDTDKIAPVFGNCPKDTVINSNQATAVNWTSPAVSDNCGIPSLSVNYPVGSVFPIGVTNVIYTATDVKNNTSTCQFKVVVSSQIVQKDICASPFACIYSQNGVLFITGIKTSAAFIQVFNSNWSPVYNQQVDKDSIAITNLTAGKYNVKVTVLETGGRWPAVCNAVLNDVNVTNAGTPCDTDTQAPTFANCPQNINLTTTGTTAVATWMTPTVTDNCTATPSVSSTHNSGFAFPIGTTTVTYTAKDAKNNSSTCSFNVVVTQQINTGDVCANPSANVKGAAGSITVSGITTSAAVVQIFNSAWTTVYNQQVSGSTVTIPNLSAGTYNVKVTVLGAGGKWPSICSNLINNIIVTNSNNPCDTDSTAPVFTNCPQNTTIETVDTFAIVNWTAPNATDNCTAPPLSANCAITPCVTVSSNFTSGSKFSIGSKTVIYTATDAKGNKGTCSFIVNVVQKNNCRYSDSLALVDVYNTMEGANWTNKWDLTKPISTWRGVYLDSSGCVQVLTPPAPANPKDYPHKISPSIGNLKSLQVLFMGNRNLVDTIPSSLGNCISLKQLQFENNNLTGKIPESFGNLINLSSLMSFNNKLTGLANGLGNLPKLRELIMHYNEFTGIIPASFSNSKTIEQIVMHHNKLSGKIPNISSIKSLDLSYNLFNDTLPSYLYSIVYTLNLSNNQFKGCIPDTYKTLCGVNVDLSNNPGLPNNGDFKLFCENGSGNCTANQYCQNDTIQPYFTQCPSTIYVKTNNDSLNVSWAPPIPFDNCTVTPSVSSNFKPNDKFPIGGTTVLYTVVDEKLNKGYCKFKIVLAPENCRQIDSLALVDLYNSTNGDSWDVTYRWNLKRPIDTWHGVELNADGCVKYFRTWSLDLNGSLPQTIGNLSSLEDLTINAQNLVGVLPHTIGKLTSLERLSIYNTKLGGTLPVTLGNLKNLRSLVIGISNISGSIPNSLGDLENLEEIILDRNKLTGSIPMEFGKLNNLKTINLFNNQLTGIIPVEIGNCNELLQLSLSNNQLTGTIPVEIGNCNKLLQVSLSNNQLTGSIPSSIENLKLIRYLYLNDNVLVGELPRNLGNLKNLMEFSASNNQLNGSIPNSIVNAPNLNILSLGNNKLTGTIPEGIEKLKNLYTLELYSNQLTGSIPQKLDSLKNIYIVNLSGNQLTGSIPANLGNLTHPNLFLHLASNQLSGCLDPNLKKLCGRSIGISGNPDLPNGGDWASFCNNGYGGCDFNNCRYTDSLALVDLYNSTNGANWYNKWDLTKPITTWYGITLNANGCVTDIKLQNNNLFGSLPTRFNFDELSILNLGENRLVGNIPNFNLPKLIELQLFTNQLSGSIPNFNLPNLSILWLYDNQLTGTIPNFNLPKLTILSLRSNRLTGTIPDFNLPSLTGLSLRDNQLTGTIPNFNLPYLSQLYLYGNQLSGSIPDFNKLTNLSLLWLHNNQLSGCIAIGLKRLCGRDVNISQNPNLPNGGDWTAFCNTGLGACVNDNLSISMTANSSTYKPFTTVTYQVKVDNKGSNAMNNIKIQFPYPPQTANGGKATPSVGAWKEYCSGGILCYEWNIPALAANATATLDVPLFILNPTGALTAQANLLTSTPIDANASDNTAFVTLNALAANSQLQSPNRPKPSQLIPVVIQAIAPNPTEGDVLIDVESIVEKEVRFDFYNTLGKVVKSELREVKKGLNHLNFDFWNTQSGIYFIQTTEGQGRGVPLKFVKL